MVLSYIDLALLCHPVLALLSISRPSGIKGRFQIPHPSYYTVSFLVLLALRYATQSSGIDPGSSMTNPLVTTANDAETCVTHDQPNPIASVYPTNATGVLNGTVALLPISLQLARSIIPPQYRILTHAYRALLPDFPKDMYPAIMQAVHDHDVQAFGYKISDFSRAGIEFPFLDLLRDNATSFKWSPSLLLTGTHTIALKGAADYGTRVYPASFTPACDAYAAVPDTTRGTTRFVASAGNASIETVFSSSSSSSSEGASKKASTRSPWPLPFFANVTNQPIFADGRTCDNMIRLFNTSLSAAPFGIESVRGSVRARVWPFPEEREERVWEDVWGVRFASAFVENNYLACEGLEGYGA